MPNLIINILLPVMILNYGAALSNALTPSMILILALLPPLGYGGYDLIKNHKTNYLALFGFINVLVTGGLGLFQFQGQAFAIKEALFPLVIGIVVWLSSFSQQPLVSAFIMNDQILNLENINRETSTATKQQQLHNHLKISTRLLSGSFLISAVLNYVIAMSIFVPIDAALPETQQQQILNDQIARMTWMGYVAIALPLTVLMLFIIWHLLSGLKKITDLDWPDLLVKS